MEISTKKSVKMTTGLQFRQLVNCMEEYPHLATGAPQFGSSKAAMENTWDTVTTKVNAYGPPLRTGSEWKKVWIDLKGRLKKKVAENNKNLNQTGGGPCRVSNLTELEVDIDRICHISVAAAPSGKVFGANTSNPTGFQITPPRGGKNVAVVTPTSSVGRSNQADETFPRQWVAFEEKSYSKPTTSEGCKLYRMSTSTPNTTALPQRKRKHCGTSGVDENERVKLLRQQCELHSQTLEAIKAQSQSAKEVAAAVKECAEAIKEQSTSLQAISKSMELMAKSIVDILWHVSEKLTPKKNQKNKKKH